MGEPITLAAGTFMASYAAILTERINRALIALLGAGALILFGIISQDQAIEAIDFNTLGLLLGMMVIVTVTRASGVFEYMALQAARLVKAQPMGLLFMFGGLTGVCSGLLDNVTTVLLVTPVALGLAKRLNVPAWPYLFSLILSANIGGISTIVGDPTVMMISSAANLSFNQFVGNMAPLAAILLVLNLGIVGFIYRRQLVATEAARKAVLAENPASAIQDWGLTYKALGVMGLVVVGFITHSLHGLEPASIAMGGAVVLLLLDNIHHSSHEQHERIQKAVAEAEWVTLLFFIGLFVLVHGLVTTGAIGWLAGHLLALVGGNFTTTGLGILWGAAILSAFVDNVPFVATMIPLVQQMAPALGGEQNITPLWWALAVGGCLGGNGSLIGASANLVVAGLAAKAGHEIKFLKFMALGFPLMLLSILVSTGYIYLRYFMAV